MGPSGNFPTHAQEEHLAKCLYDAAQIADRIAKLGEQISRDLKGSAGLHKSPLVLVQLA